MVAHSPPGRTRERVYRYVRERLERGAPPTIREVRDALGFRAVETARQHLETLVDEGRLAKEPGKARGYRLPGRPDRMPTLVPLLGRVQAGDLTAAIEDLEGYIPFLTTTPDRVFGLRVRGESMTGAGIFPGDIVIVRSQPTADPGDIVVALVDDEATIKTLRTRRGRVELHPANADFEPVIPPSDRCTILGKVVEVRRLLEETAR